MIKFILVLLVSVLLLSCASSRKLANHSIQSLRFIGEYFVPHEATFNGTKIGGLSGIDYDPVDSSYYLICDDRSEYNEARFYTAKIFFSNTAIDSLRFTGVTTLLQPDGKFYPSHKVDAGRSPDPEAMRLNRPAGQLVWSSEGERLIRDGTVILQDPSINVMSKKGGFVERYPLPANLHVTGSEGGPRRNGVFEGLAFMPDFKTLYVSVEEPLYEDGPRAGAGDSAAWIRILKYDVATRAPVAQYAYRIDPIVKTPIPAGGFAINGVVDIVALGEQRLLVTERSYSTGHTGCSIRVYLVDMKDADNLAINPSLVKTPPEKYLQKKLLLDMNRLGRQIYNVEGATFGPLLPNGKRSLLFVADNNFSAKEKTQLLLFEVN